MKIKSNGFDVYLSIEEIIALAKLLGNLSVETMVKQGCVDYEEADLLQAMYGTLSAFVPAE